MTFWGRWVRRPQELFLRKALFQIHLWTGIGVGVYVLVVCVSGSVLVYRNELYRTFSPQPTVVAGSGESIALEDLESAARRAYPGYEVTDVRTGETANHAVEISLKHGKKMKRRLFHPFTGEDLGDPVPAGFRFTAWLLDLHDNLLGGETGRRINGIGALFVTLLSLTGAIIWWPGIKSWRRSLTLDYRANWNRLNWSLHSALGFWFFAFVLLWGITGLYLSFPQVFAAGFDLLEPFDESHPVERVVDRIQYWLAYLHFGRLGGRGIPGCGRGLCDSTTKVIWAVFGLVPPLMFVTGALMWWNRVTRPARRTESVR
jgi:uncharacterized iron-regulated membrane protein